MNTEYKLLKKKAISLRRKGLSYGVISKKLNISKSTASFWLRKIKLTNKQINQLNNNKAFHLNFGENSQKERRRRDVEKIIYNSKREINEKINLQSLKLFGAALYWAEGSKKNMFDMTNSDPYLIAFWVKWLEKIFNLKANYLKIRLNIYPQQSERDIKNFWSKLTGIPIKNFGKSYIKPLSNNYKKNNLYYGTARIEVPKSTDYRYRVYGWKQKILEKMIPKLNIDKNIWNILKKVAKPKKIK